ncbi:uncharacterized protein [Branchiostoma lanceolatum]|uniref:uncharacterized protein isoform X2 n=1 Tax=Branchiostoma lanceolatum TaxID=7740 RepID=UPI0034572886
MASPLGPDSSLSTISPEGTPDVTPSASRQSSRLTDIGEESVSRRPSKVMFTSTPKSERSRGASIDQLRRDSSTLSDQGQLRRDSSTLSDQGQLRRDSSTLSDQGQLRRDSSTMSDQGQLRRDSSTLSDQGQLRRDSSTLSDQGQLRRDSSTLSDQGQLRRDSSTLSDQGQLRRDSSTLSDQGQLRRDSSTMSDQGQLRRDSSTLSDQGQLRRDSSTLSDQGQLRRDSSTLPYQGQLRRDSSALSDQGQLRRDSSALSDQGQLRRDSSTLSNQGQLRRDSSIMSDQGQLRQDSSTLSARYPSTLCTDDLEPWDSLPRGYLTSSSSGLLTPQKSQEKGDVLTRESTPTSSMLFARSLERSRDSFARESPSMPSLQPQSSHQPPDSTAALARVSSGPSELTSQRKASDMDTTLNNDSLPASATKLFSEPSRESAASSRPSVHGPSVGVTPVLSPRRSYEGSAEALGSSRSTSRTSARESSSLLGGVGHKATVTRGSGRRGAESSGSADDSEILRRLTKLNERMFNENDLLRNQLKLFKCNAELKQISLISLVIAWHQGLLSADECQSLSDLSQLCSEDDSGGASVSGRRLGRCLKELSSLRPPRDASTRRRAREAPGPDPVLDESSVRSSRDTASRRRASKASGPDPTWQESSVRSSRDTGRRRRAQEASGPDPVWLESSVREIKRVLHHLERTLIDLDSTVRDHQCLWRDMRRRGPLPLPATGSVEGASAPKLYIPRPHAEHSGTAVQFETKDSTQSKVNDSGLGGSFSERGSFAGGGQEMDGRARRSSESHDVREARLLGEVCHQLEQRVLVSVFPRQKVDPASFSLRTIGDLVRLERDPDEKEFLTRKLGRVTATLRLYGFDFQRHPFFMTDVMLRFGKFPTDWDKYSFVHQKGYQDPELLREAVDRLAPDPFRLP